MAHAAPLCALARARILRARGQEAEANEAIAQAARIAEELHDDELRALVASEWWRP
jgi:hypothetical protein